MLVQYKGKKNEFNTGTVFWGTGKLKDPKKASIVAYMSYIRLEFLFVLYYQKTFRV